MIEIAKRPSKHPRELIISQLKRARRGQPGHTIKPGQVASLAVNKFKRGHIKAKDALGATRAACEWLRLPKRETEQVVAQVKAEIAKLRGYK